MKVLRRKMIRRTVAMLMLDVLILTGCSTPRFCRARLCNSRATKSCYNVDNSEDVRYYCKNCIPICDLCYNEAVKFKESEGWEVYVCNSCNYWELLEMYKRRGS